MNRYFRILLLLLIATKADAQNTSALAVGDSLYALGNYSQAIEHYKKTDRAEEKIASAYAALGNDAMAAKFFEMAMARAEVSELTTYQYGKVLLKTANYQKADSLFTHLTENSKNPEFYYQLGLAKEKANDSMYVVPFRQAVNLDSNHLNARYKLAKYLAEKRAFDEAMEHVEVGLQSNPKSIRFLNLKAIIAYVNKSYHEAIASYKALEALQQSNIPLHENLAESYRYTYQYQKAIEQYTILINEYDDKVPSWHFGIANCFEMLQYLDKAQHHFEVAILLQDLPLDESYVALAKVFRKQKNYLKQFETLQIAVRENPENQEAVYLLATAADNYFENDQEVIPFYEKYLELFGEQRRYSELAKARIKDLKTEIHMNKEKQ
ncbi:MAG: hypothetical protein R3359_08245 [Marinirhabdus sp.]|nr:hypothetical protein [Marinirhabdus sp.]